MKTTKKWSRMLLVGMTATLAFGLVLVGCDNGSGGVRDTVATKMYNELKSAKKKVSSDFRSISMPAGISTNYLAAVAAYYVNGYDTADGNPIEDRNWEGVTEGGIQLDYHGLNGDGLEIWVFVSIQGGEPWVIFANKDASFAASLPDGVSERTDKSWFYKF
jgi:hypothetical protein